MDAAGNTVTTNTTGAYIFTPTPGFGTNLVGSPIVDPIFGGPGTFQYQLDDNFFGPGLGKFSAAKTVSVNITPVDNGPGTLTLAGVLAVGGTLTATVSGDPEGIGIAPVFTWRNNGAVMAGVTGPTYTLTPADLGHTFSVSATYIDGQNFTTTVSTATTNPAGQVLVKPTTTVPSAPVDASVTASSNLTPLFGTAAIPPVTYSWQTSTDQITWTTVTATGTKFAPAPTGVAGEYIRALASYVDGAGVTQSVPSLPVHYINDRGVTTGRHPDGAWHHRPDLRWRRQRRDHGRCRGRLCQHWRGQ